MSTSRILLGAAALLGLAGAVPARASLEAVTQGESFANQYAPEFRGNIVGGGFARETMPGDNSTILYADSTIGRRAPGTPVFVGGHNGDVAYLTTPASMPVSRASRQR
ncbi:MAG TPA: hypothetical protein VNR89_15975 [Roseomonas sp.]|nr:hypothetical protein [Roseomonas sp.]